MVGSVAKSVMVGLAQVIVNVLPGGLKVNTGKPGWALIVMLAMALHPPAAVTVAEYMPGAELLALVWVLLVIPVG